MRVSKAIFSTLSGLAGITLAIGSTEGCGWFGSCPDQTSFSEDEEITARLVQDVLAGDYQGPGDGTGDASSAAELSCEQFCTAVRGGAVGFESLSVDSCTHDIGGYEPPPEAGTDTGTDTGTEGGDEAGTEGDIPGDTVVGSVQCSGSYTPECLGGRRPLGHREAKLKNCPDAMGRSFAGLAHLEAASVVAFVQLGRQLSGWGAPADLVARCQAAARDEVRHAKTMRGFATAHGAEVPSVVRGPADEDLLTAAIHNATEGCVSETWAALLAHVQAHEADDARVREAYVTIAADETRHAQLAWDLHEWFLGRLDAKAQEVVVAAQREAISKLSAVARAQAKSLPPELGIPDAELAARMAEDFGTRLVAA